MPNFLLWLWSRLTAPTTHRPEEYRGRRIARTVNDAIDGDVHGAAHQALMGESVALAADSLVQAPTANTPLGYLIKATGTYVVLTCTPLRGRTGQRVGEGGFEQAQTMVLGDDRARSSRKRAI